MQADIHDLSAVVPKKHGAVKEKPAAAPKQRVPRKSAKERALQQEKTAKEKAEQAKLADMLQVDHDSEGHSKAQHG